MSNLKPSTVPSPRGTGTPLGQANQDWLTLLSKKLAWLTLAMHYIAGVVLVFMMCVTMADIVSRALFGITKGGIDLTFIGGIELTKYGLLTLVLFALPHSVSRSQVIVDLFTDSWQTRTKSLFEGTYMLGYVLLGSGMSYRFYHAVGYAAETGETTQDLFIPMGYLYGLCSFATAILALTALITSLNLLINGREEAAR